MSKDFGYNDHLIRQFTQGDCWLLAWELHKRGGFPIFVLYDYDEAVSYMDVNTPKSELAFQEWLHVVVKVDNDQYVDIRGVQSRSELESLWDGDLTKMPKKAVRGFKPYADWLCGGNIEESRYYDLPENRDPAEVADDIMSIISIPDEVAA